MPWINVPAHRILVVSRHELLTEYEPVDEKGETVKSGGLIYRIIRKADNKVFKPGAFLPAEFMARDLFAMEEI